MAGRVRRGAIVGMLAVAVSCAAAGQTSAAVTVGSNLLSTPNAGVCGFESAAVTDRPCTVSQSWLAYGRVSPAGLRAPMSGVITRWALLSGPATPGTASVKLRLRTIGASQGGASGELVDLPLNPPGEQSYRSFPARLPVYQGQAVGLTALVSGRGEGPASVPIAYQGPEIGAVDFWESALAEGTTGIWYQQEQTELLMNAEIEPDVDGDGYGDDSQDLCPTDRSRQGPCALRDLQPPLTRLTYRSSQDFLERGAVVLRLRSSELGTAFARARLKIEGRRGATYDLPSDSKSVGARSTSTLRLRLGKAVRQAAARAVAQGKKVVVVATAFVTDLAGNRGGVTVVTVRPPA
jgi:hypothetical protein